ncbi:MAG: helix-turn-helix transcriptional regulator [Verrucomicrobiales bacterium]|nr:helix-turn-helix transcriptional regulator [Verrucomicrobiales bacterium]
MTKKFLTIEERAAHRSLEDVVGCRWSTAVVGAIQDGIKRPGKLRRYIPGISTKVLNERLKKLLDYGLAIRDDFSGNSLHVEYSLTLRGEKLARLIEQLRDLDDEYQAEEKSQNGR